MKTQQELQEQLKESYMDYRHGLTSVNKLMTREDVSISDMASLLTPMAEYAADMAKKIKVIEGILYGENVPELWILTDDRVLEPEVSLKNKWINRLDREHSWLDFPEWVEAYAEQAKGRCVRRSAKYRGSMFFDVELEASDDPLTILKANMHRGDEVAEAVIDIAGENIDFDNFKVCTSKGFSNDVKVVINYTEGDNIKGLVMLKKGLEHENILDYTNLI